MFFFLPADAQSLSLISSPQLNGPICPGPTCVGTRVPFILEWRLNDTVRGEYAFRGDTRPVNITLNPPIPGVMAQVINVSHNVTVNIISTMSGEASILEGS